MEQLIEGEGHRIAIDATAVHRGADLHVKGTGHSVEIGAGSDVRDMQFKVMGTGNRLVIGAGCKLRGQFLLKGKNHTLHIGDFTTMVNCYLLAQEGDIRVGRHCMFSREIEIRTTDAHSIVDLATRKRLNDSGSVVIGEHVWLSAGVLVSKGVTIAPDVIVGARAGVFRSLTESNVVVVGTPARVVRRGVTWNRARKASFTEDELFAWQREPAGPASFG